MRCDAVAHWEGHLVREGRTNTRCVGRAVANNRAVAVAVLQTFALQGGTPGGGAP